MIKQNGKKVTEKEYVREALQTMICDTHEYIERKLEIHGYYDDGYWDLTEMTDNEKQAIEQRVSDYIDRMWDLFNECEDEPANEWTILMSQKRS